MTRARMSAPTAYSPERTQVPGGPCLPTGKTLNKSDYVYVMDFDGDKIRHMTKIWPDTWALQQLGWA